MILVNDIAAVHHILRHLHNARALRRNYLAAPFFGQSPDNKSVVADRLLRASFGKRILAIVEDLKIPEQQRTAISSRRHYDIISRYDIGGESRDLVQNALGIGKSKFYLERRAGLARIAEALRMTETSPKVDQAHVVDTYTMELSHIETVISAGELALAAKLLNRLLVGGPAEDDRQMEVLAQLIVVHCKLGLLQEARGIYSNMAQLASGSRRSTHNIWFQVELQFAACQLADYASLTIEAIHFAEHVVHLLAGQRRIPMRRAALIAASAYECIGVNKAFHDNIGEGVEALFRANNILDEAPQAPKVMKLKALQRLAHILASVPGRMGCARKLMSQALDLAYETSSMPKVAWAHAGESMLRHFAGDDKGALRHAALAQPIADALLSPPKAAVVSVMHARAELACGQAHQALSRLANVREQLDKVSYEAVLALVVESEALLTLGYSDTALKTSRVAETSAAALHNRYLMGLSLFASAEAYECLGRMDCARAAITASIDAFAHGNRAYALARAFELSARLTGRKRHGNNAADLFSGLRAPYGAAT